MSQMELTHFVKVTIYNPEQKKFKTICLDVYIYLKHMFNLNLILNNMFEVSWGKGQQKSGEVVNSPKTAAWKGLLTTR